MPCAKALRSLLAVAVVLIAIFNAAYSHAQGFEVLPWPPGKAVPTTVGVDAQGRTVLLKELRGKAVLINFWASWCEPCTAEMPSLQTAAQQHGADHLAVLAVNFKEPGPTVERFVQRSALTLPVLLDPQGEVARAWGVHVFPTTVLLGADGRVRRVVRGPLDWTGSQANALIESVLSKRK